MKKIFLSLLAVIMLFTLTSCGDKNNETGLSGESSVISHDDTATVEDDVYIDDDEIIDWDDEDNEPYVEEKVVVEEVINCDGCVYSYFSDDKSFGTTLSEDEYTTDIRTLKTMGGKQRHNFFGLILTDNKITRAHPCILKDNKIYCLEGSVDGSYHESNVAILNQIFSEGQCKYISNGHTYTCTDGDYNGDTITTGYASLHYETSCTVFGSEGKTGKMSCN